MRTSSHFFQFSSFFSHSSKVSSVGGSKPHLLVEPELAAATATGAAFGTGGLAENADFTLYRPKRLAYVPTMAITI